jgi:nucleoside-diphosphate-sugar epimerase
MPRVLILGATGYLASRIAQVLLLTGNHTVYGLTRSGSKSAALLAAEVSPIVCPDPASDPKPYLEAIKQHHIDIVIDATSAYGDSVKFLENVADLARRNRSELTNAPRLGYIYISGLWVLGSSPSPVTDLDPVGTPEAVTKPLAIVGWRPDLERRVLASRDVLNVCVIRPAQMFGYASSAWSAALALIKEAVKNRENSIQMPFNPGARVATCHVDDVADAIRCAAERIEGFGSEAYPVFDVVLGQEDLQHILQGFADVLATSDGQGSGNRTTVKLVGENDDVYMQALGSTINASNARAKQILGWSPRRRAMGADIEVYTRAWEVAFGGSRG